MTRFKARDVFDLNELILNETKINFDLINKKLQLRGLNIMRDWRTALKEYLHNYYENYL